MKASELKEVFDIFITKLDENKKILDANQKIFEVTQRLEEEKNQILSAIESKAATIATFKPVITYQIPALERFAHDQNEVLNKELEKIRSNFKICNQDLENKLKSINTESRKNDKTKLYLLVAFMVLLLSNLSILAYAINQKTEKDIFIMRANSYRKSANNRGQYIKEKGLSEKYNKWLGEQ